jgi:small-conductance mechanosensitive channel
MHSVIHMTQELIYENLYSVLSLADSILQIWLTVTFAVIVATHLASALISDFIYFLLATLYGLASCILLARDISSAYQIYSYHELLIENGFEPWPVPPLFPQIIGAGTLLLMILGTVVTIWFIFSTRKRTIRGSA